MTSRRYHGDKPGWTWSYVELQPLSSLFFPAKVAAPDEAVPGSHSLEGAARGLPGNGNRISHELNELISLNSFNSWLILSS